MINKRLLIIQPDCRSYRIDFFKKLSNEIGSFSLFHNGPLVFENSNLVNEKNIKIINFKSFKIVPNLKEIIKDFDVIILGHDFHWINLFFLPLLTNKTIIFWSHGPGRSKLLKPLRFLTAHNANSIITYSEIGKKKYIDIGIKKQKIFVAPNTLHVGNSEDTSIELSKNSFIFLGRLQRRKKLDIFFEAYKDAVLDKKNIKIIIIGDGEEEKQFLINKAKQLNILHLIEFVKGTSDNKILISYFKKSYAYISPGAVGLGLLHSFAFGTPVISMPDNMHGPEIENLKDGYNGYFATDKKDLVEKLKLAIINHSEIGHNAYQTYSLNCSLINMVDGFKAAINYSI